MRALAIVAAFAALPAPAVAADCMQMGLEPQLLTHGGDVLPADGGVLIGWQSSSSAPGGVADPADQPDWRFRAGKRVVKPVRTTLAPGLVRYGVGTTLKRTRKGTKVKLGTLASFVARKTGATPRFKAAAPAVHALTVTTTPGRRGDRTVATVTLDAAPPSDAYGLILYALDGTAATAISWTPVNASTATSFTIYASPGSCGTVPSGMRAPTPGADVALAWVDSYGRLSPRSGAVTTQ